MTYQEDDVHEAAEVEGGENCLNEVACCGEDKVGHAVLEEQTADTALSSP